MYDFNSLINCYIKLKKQDEHLKNKRDINPMTVFS